MDPTHKMNLKPTPLTTTTKSRLQDPTAIHPSTIQNISHRFSKLYGNHKKLVSNGGHSKSPPHPQRDSRFQEKTLTFSHVSDTSSTALTKSNSQNGRSDNLMVTKVVEKEKFSTRTKKPSSKKDPKKSSIEVYDVKKASQLMSKSLESDQVKRFHQGFELKRYSVSSIPPIINGGRRKSFCSSQIELADFFSCNGVKVVAVDMPSFMQIHAVDIARKTHDSLEKFTSKTLAFTLKKEFDGAYGPAWHCIVGTSFGSFVTHSVGGFMYFSMDHKIYILLFKTTVQKAE